MIKNRCVYKEILAFTGFKFVVIRHTANTINTLYSIQIINNVDKTVHVLKLQNVIDTN